MPRPPRRTQDIRIFTEIKAKPEKVYRALVSARELCVWLLDRAETDSRSMGRMRMVWPVRDKKKRVEATGVFVDLEPGKKVAWIWDEQTRPSGLPALVTVFIEEKGSRCQVTLVHAGFSVAPSRAGLIKAYREMWEDVLVKLKLYLESGRVCKGDRLTLADAGPRKKSGRRA
ncbi:MAG: SRPBCC domain-containing protein [Elusimicrobiota bacterium]